MKSQLSLQIDDAWGSPEFRLITCQPCSNRLRSTARSHITASPAWKSRSLKQRSRKKMPKHFSNSDVEACKKEKRSKRSVKKSTWSVSVREEPCKRLMCCLFECSKVFWEDDRDTFKANLRGSTDSNNHLRYFHLGFQLKFFLNQTVTGVVSKSIMCLYHRVMKRMRFLQQIKF